MVDFGVEAQAPSSVAASDANTHRMTILIVALLNAGITHPTASPRAHKVPAATHDQCLILVLLG